MRWNRFSRYADGAFFAAIGVATIGLGLHFSPGQDAGLAAQSLLAAAVGLVLFLFPRLIDLEKMTGLFSWIAGWAWAILVWLLVSSIPPSLILGIHVFLTAGMLSHPVRPPFAWFSLVAIWCSVFLAFLMGRESLGAASLVLSAGIWLASSDVRRWKVTGLLTLGICIVLLFGFHRFPSFPESLRLDPMLFQIHATFRQGGLLGQTISIPFPVTDHRALAALGLARGWIGIAIYLTALFLAFHCVYIVKNESKAPGTALNATVGVMCLCASGALLSATSLLGWQPVPGRLPLLSLDPALTVLALWASGSTRHFLLKGNEGQPV